MKKIAFVFIINLLLFSCSKEVYKPTTSYKTIQNTNSNNNVDKSLVRRNSSGAEILNCNQIQSNRSTTSQYMYITLVD